MRNTVFLCDTGSDKRFTTLSLTSDTDAPLSRSLVVGWLLVSNWMYIEFAELIFNMTDCGPVSANCDAIPRPLWSLKSTPWYCVYLLRRNDNKLAAPSDCYNFSPRVQLRDSSNIVPTFSDTSG